MACSDFRSEIRLFQTISTRIVYVVDKFVSQKTLQFAYRFSFLSVSLACSFGKQPHFGKIRKKRHMYFSRQFLGFSLFRRTGAGTWTGGGAYHGHVVQNGGGTGLGQWRARNGWRGGAGDAGHARQVAATVRHLVKGFSTGDFDWAGFWLALTV